MLQKISQIGLVSVTLLSFINLPMLAETTASQTASLEATVNGENNQVYQTINQTIINHPGKGAIQRNQRNYHKTPQKSSRSLSHRHSDDIEHPRRNDD